VADERRETSRTVDLDPRSVATAMGAFVVLVAITGLVRTAPRSITWLVTGSLLALALNPLVVAVQRRMSGHRMRAVAVVLLGLVMVVAVLVAMLVPPGVRQARDLGDEIPEVVESLADVPFVGDDLVRNDVPEKVRNWLEDLPDRLTGENSPVPDVGRSLIGGTLAAVATLLISITLLLDADGLRYRARAFVPRRHRDRAARFASIAYRVVGRYFAGSVLVAAIAGVYVLIVGLALGIPLTPLMALWVALFDLVPQIGGAVGGIPFVLLGFTQSAGIGVLTAVLFVLYLQFENHVVQPLVVGEAVNLSPPATMTAALVGVSAAGVVGALVAVPLLGAAKALYLEMRAHPAPPIG
jgi:predicted PurR-regulated permease PerM